MQQSVTFEINDWNNLIFHFTYGEMTFSFEWSEPYLHDEKYWQNQLKQIQTLQRLQVHEGEGKGDENVITLFLPKSLVSLFVDEIKKAMADPRIKEFPPEEEDELQ